MPAAFVQTISNSTGSTSNAPVSSGNFPSANTAANLLVYAVFYDGNSGGSEPTFTLSDTVGDVPAKIMSIWDSSNALKMEIGYFKNIAGGTNAVTCTFGGSGIASAFYKGVAAFEYSGLDTVTPFVAGEYNGAEQSPSGTTANSLSSGSTPTLASQPALIFGISSNAHNLSGPPTVGTGFTANGSAFWQFATGTNFAQAESQRVLSTTGIAATFTPSTSGSHFFTFVAAFHEPAILTASSYPMDGEEYY